MAASPVPAPAARAAPRVGLAEWFRLRRYPHPDFVDSLDKMPPSLSTIVEQALPAGRAIAGALLLPAEYYARKMIVWEYVPERALVFLDRGVVYATAEGPDAPSSVMTVDAQALLYVRSSLLLLYGLLEFKADCGGEAELLRLEYNTVIWQALRGPLTSFIAAASTYPSMQDPPDLAEVKAINAPMLDALPFKFANGLRYYALTPDERLRAAVFQTAIWEKRGILPRQVTPNTMFALTDRKLVIIEEKRASVWHRQSSQGEYGWIFTYIPLDRVVDIVVSSSAGRAELGLRLEWGGAKDERSFILAPAIAAEWDSAWLDTHHNLS